MLANPRRRGPKQRIRPSALGFDARPRGAPELPELQRAHRGRRSARSDRGERMDRGWVREVALGVFQGPAKTEWTLGSKH